MILTKNLASSFLDACKKDNLPRLVSIVNQAKEANISIDYASGLLKGVRHGVISSVRYILDNYAIDEKT